MAEKKPLSLDDLLSRKGSTGNSLRDEMLRRDLGAAGVQERARKEGEIKRFLDSKEGERKAKLSETTGLSDLLTFLPAKFAAKALKTGRLGNAAVNALAFTSQFDDSKLGRNVQDTLAFMPIMGIRSTKGLARAQERLRKLAEKGKVGNLPVFDTAAKISPKRFKEIVGGIESGILAGSSKNPEKHLDDLAEWAKRWASGNKPVDGSRAIGAMPASLRSHLYDWAAERGYGGVKTVAQSKAPMDKVGNRLTRAENLAELEARGAYTSGGRMNPTQETPVGVRSMEEIRKFAQSGGVPKRWEEAFKQQQKAELGERAKNYIEQLGIGSAIGLGADLLSPGKPGGEGTGDNLAVVNPLTKLRRKVAIANNPEFWVQSPKEVFKTRPENRWTLPEYTAIRAQNSSGILPTLGNNRLGHYFMAETPEAGRLTGRKLLTVPDSDYKTSIKSTMEGGTSTISGKASPKNPLYLTPGRDTFFGNSAIEAVGSEKKGLPSGRYLHDIEKFDQIPVKYMNKFLPKSIRLTNNDFRKLGERHYAGGRVGKTSDALGDYLINKYARFYGKDVVEPRVNMKANPYAEKEIMIPEESRWNSRPAYTSDWRSIYQAIKSDYNSIEELKRLLKRSPKTPKPVPKKPEVIKEPHFTFADDEDILF